MKSLLKKEIPVCLFVLSLLFFLPSCKDFLEVKPKGVIIPEKLSDYENILNSFTMTQTFPSALLYCTDDYYEDYSPIDRSVQANMFFWRREVDVNDQVSPAIWGQLYRVIYDANVIVKHVMNAKEGTVQKKKEVLGEALLVRANAYFTLLTAFAKAYDPATAGTDPGLPLITSNDVTEVAPQRSRLQTTLDSIINNAQRAVEYLPLNNLNRYRSTRAGAQGFLARVYLYIGDYQKAGSYSEEALKAAHQLINYNTLGSKDDLPVTDLNPEILWQRASDEFNLPNFMLYSDNLKGYFNASDLRYTLFSGTNAKGLYRSVARGWGNFGITFPELYLNVAETAARANQLSKAMEMLNKIRVLRIKSNAYQPLTASDPESALAAVLAERRRELAFGDLRWMDMKRLDKENRMPDVQRINRKTGALLATLKAHSKDYTLQIPVRVRNFNPKMELN